MMLQLGASICLLLMLWMLLLMLLLLLSVARCLGKV